MILTEMAHDDVMRTEIRLGRQGRLVIPAAIRRALGYEEGDELVAYVMDGQLIISTQESILDTLQGLVADVEPGRSWVDELIAERREEARMENEGEREWLEQHSTRRRSSP